MRRVWRQCAGHAAGGAGLYLPPHQNAQAPPAEPPQGASRRAPSVKVAPSDISGNWAVCEATNVTEFLTTFGIPEVALKVGAVLQIGGLPHYGDRLQGHPDDAQVGPGVRGGGQCRSGASIIHTE
jgi:hypothetical protein